MYQASLVQVQEAINSMEELDIQLKELKTFTKETIEINNKAYKEDLIKESEQHLKMALDNLTGTVIPYLNKKIEEK